jgi:hypothetical protein
MYYGQGEALMMIRMNRMRSIHLGLVALASLSTSIGQAQPSASVAGSGYITPVPFPIAPGTLTTIFVQGMGNGIGGAVLASGLPLPTKLNGISVSLKQTESPQGPIPVPILAVFPVPACQTVFQNCRQAHRHQCSDSLRAGPQPITDRPKPYKLRAAHRSGRRWCASSR